MLKLRLLTPLGAVFLSATLLAQQDGPTAPPPPPPPTPDEAPAVPKINIPPAKPETSAAAPDSAEEPDPKPKPAPRVRRKATTPMPVATPIPDATPKPGFFQRLFGPRKRTRTRDTEKEKDTKPEIAEKSTPTPKPRTKTTRKPAPPKDDDSEKATPAPEPKEKTTPAPKATPKPKAEPDKDKDEAMAKPAPEPKATPAPKPKATPKPSAKKPAATAGDDKGADTEMDERAKFAEAKSKAMEDSDVAALKAKADGAETRDQARTALRAYNKALFQKMRKLDPSIKDRIDAMESAMMKRLAE